MKRVIVFLLIGLNLFAAKDLFVEYKAKILQIIGDTAIVKGSETVKKGASGIIIHHFDKTHSSIVARAIVTDVSKQKIRVRFEVFDDLKQDALPSPDIRPQVGDTILLNYLYDRAIAIVPDFNLYQEVTNRYKDINWIHPDIFAAKLAKENNPAPKREDFKKVCQNFSASLLFFALEQKGYFVDCYSFSILKTTPLPKAKSVQLPFYTRINDIKSSWLSFSDEKIEDYNQYYLNLLDKE